MTTIDDLWDEPIAAASPLRPTNSNGDASNNPLFLDSDSDNEAGASKVPQEVNDLFNDLDAPDEEVIGITPALDLDALRRAASAKHGLNSTPYEILPSSSPHKERDENDKGNDKEEEGTKKRKKIPRLDEGRLLSPIGIPALMKEAKKFKIKGKGHEASDLNRLLTVYQYWAHQLYPRNQFNDTIDRVEKLCHSRRMHVALSVWHDESKGLINGKTPEELIEIDSDDNDEGADVETPADGTSDPPTRPPSSASERTSANDDDTEIDAMIREDEEMQRQASNPTTSYKPQSKQPATNDDDAFDKEFDVSMWEDFAFADDPPANSKGPSAPSPPPGANEDQDQDMWDIFAELEQESSAPAIAPKPANTSSYLDDWDDMYA